MSITIFLLQRDSGQDAKIIALQYTMYAIAEYN